MNNVRYIFIILFVALLLASCSASTSDMVDGDVEQEWTFVPGQCSPNNEEFPIRPEPTVAASLPKLHVSGTKLLDDLDNPVALRGTNFGSWLLIEAWIPGFKVHTDDFQKGIEDFKQRARDGGCGDAMEEGVSEGMVMYLLGDENFLEILDAVREASYGAAITPEELQCLDDVWAWWDSQPWIHGEEELWGYLLQRFGPMRMDELRTTYRDNWITELDFERVAAAGMNVIRLPFWYDAFETGEPDESHFRPNGWQRLAWAVDMARKYKLYLIIDMHGAPGGQSREPHCGTSRGNKLWGNQACIDKTARLWGAIAAFLQGEPHVAALDLLNEPMTLPDKETYTTVLQTIYSAIRTQDAQAIVMYEDGYKSPSSIPTPQELGWQQCMFSIHIYSESSSPQETADSYGDTLHKWDDYWQGEYGVPLLVGEFAMGGYDQKSLDSMDAILERFNSEGVHWTPWTFKYWNDESYWGMYHHEDINFVEMDVRVLSDAALEERFVNLNSLHFVAHEEFLSIITQRAGDNFGTISGEKLE